RQAVLLAERAVRRLVLNADAQDDRSDRPERRGVVSEGTCFSSASRGVVLRIEKQHDRLALEVPEVDRDAVLVRPLEIGRSGAGTSRERVEGPGPGPGSSPRDRCGLPSGQTALASRPA